MLALRLAPRRPADSLILSGSVIAALIALAALATALWTPGSFDLTMARDAAGHRVVAWLAPNGSADGNGLMSGDVIVRWNLQSPTPGILTALAGHQRVVLTAATLAPTRLDLFDSGLGLLLVAFWRLSLLAGVALALAPAGRHGVLWLLPLEPLALGLFGPAFVELARAMPGRRRGPLRRPWRPGALWLPALAYLLCYAAYYRQPALLAPLMPLVNCAVTGGYIVAGCLRAGATLRRPCSAEARAQLQWVALGLICGFLPFVLLAALPSVLIGHELVPAQVSILPILLLVVGIGLAVMHAEYLGITDLVRRDALHVLLNVALLAGLTWIAGLLAEAGPARWGWPTSHTVIGVGVLMIVAALTLRPRLIRCIERYVLHDVYDQSDVVREVRVLLEQSPARDAVLGVLYLLCTALNLSDALLLTPEDEWSCTHPRATEPEAEQEAMIERARRLFAAPPPADDMVEHIGGRQIHCLPIRDGSTVLGAAVPAPQALRR